MSRCVCKLYPKALSTSATANTDFLNAPNKLPPHVHTMDNKDDGVLVESL